MNEEKVFQDIEYSSGELHVIVTEDNTVIFRITGHGGRIIAPDVEIAGSQVKELIDFIKRVVDSEQKE